MKTMQHTNFNILRAGVALLALLFTLLLQSCGQPNEGNTATVSVRLAGIAEQKSRSLDSREFDGGSANVSQIIITIKNLDTGAIIETADIMQSGGAATFTVPAHVKMMLTGDGYQDGVLVLQGEVEVRALRPGESDNPSLTLNDVGSPTGTTLTGVVSIAGFGGNSTISLIELDSGGNQVGPAIAEAMLDTQGAFAITFPTSIIADSKYVFRAIDNPMSEGSIWVDARFTNSNADLTANTLTINEQTTAVSDIVGVLASNGNIQDISTEITLAEISEIEQVVAEIDRFLDVSNISTPPAYSSAVYTQAINNLEYSNVISSVAARGQICGSVRIDLDGTTEPLSGIRMQVLDFDTQLLRANTYTDTNGDYCVDLPEEIERNLLTGADAKGEYIIGAMNYTDNNNVGSAWWVSNEVVDLTPNVTSRLRIDAEKIMLYTVSNTAAAVINPASIDFILRPGAIVAGNVTGSSEGPIPLSDITVILRDSVTHFLSAAVKTDTQGNYRVSAMPGSYIIEALNTTPAQSLQKTRPYASTTFVTGGVNPTGSNRRNFGKVVTLSANNVINQHDFLLQPGVQITGKVTEPSETGPVPINAVRVVFNMWAGGRNDSPASRLRSKNVDGSFGVWLKQDSYAIFAYGQRQDLDTSDAAPGSSIALQDFAAAVAKLPVRVDASSMGLNVKPSQIKFELFENLFSDGSTLMHTDFSRSDGRLTLYSQNLAQHVVVARLDQARSTERPYASAVYAGMNKKGFTQRNIGLPISLTPGTKEATLTFIPMQVGGTLTGRVVRSDVNSNQTPMGNILVRVLHKVSNATSHPSPRFVETRTRSDGTYTLSLPQATYTQIEFTDTATTNPTMVCDYVPVFNNEITTLDLVSAATANTCTQSAIPSPYTKVGNIYFDPDTSSDLTQHPLYVHPMLIPGQRRGWEMVDSNDINNFMSYTFSIALSPAGVQVAASDTPATEQAREQCAFGGGNILLVESLAVDIGGDIYSLATDNIAHVNPILQLRSELAKDVAWDITDGTDTPNPGGVVVRTATVVGLNISSPGGVLGTDHISYAYTDVNNPIVEDLYFKEGAGLQEEITRDSSVQPPANGILNNWKRTVNDNPGLISCGVGQAGV